MASTYSNCRAEGPKACLRIALSLLALRRLRSPRYLYLITGSNRRREIRMAHTYSQQSIQS